MNSLVQEVVVGRVDPFPAAQVGDGRFPAEPFQNDPDLLFRRVFTARRPADASHKAVGFLSALLGLLSGRHGFMGGVDFGHGLAPSSGIYPRELNPADLSISSGPKTVPLLLTSDTQGLINERGFRLDRWVAARRREYARGDLAQERIDVLNSLSFIWDANEYKKQTKNIN